MPSGGGSFLIPSPRPPISLEDLIVMTKELENNGASAKDINIVRKNVEFLKSGGLVTAARPAKVKLKVFAENINFYFDAKLKLLHIPLGA